MTDAEYLWREACWAFLGACFEGAPRDVIAFLARQMFIARVHVSDMVLFTRRKPEFILDAH